MELVHFVHNSTCQADSAVLRRTEAPALPIEVVRTKRREIAATHDWFCANPELSGVGDNDEEVLALV